MGRGFDLTFGIQRKGAKGAEKDLSNKKNSMDWNLPRMPDIPWTQCSHEQKTFVFFAPSRLCVGFQTYINTFFIPPRSVATGFAPARLGGMPATTALVL
jgi:hypothetical protein